jgi:hypothetical protein
MIAFVALSCDLPDILPVNYCTAGVCPVVGRARGVEQWLDASYG